MDNGQVGGDIYIRSGKFVLNGTYDKENKVPNPVIITSSNYGNENGGKIDIQSSDEIKLDNVAIYNTTKGEGKGEDISITAKDITISNTMIVNNTDGYAKGGNININSGSIISGDKNAQGNTLVTGTRGNKNAGNIVLWADKIDMDSNNNITSYSTSNGNSGTIDINSHEYIKFSGHIYSNAYADKNNTNNGNSGNIYINSPILELNAGELQASTSSHGSAGSIELNVNTLKMSKGAQINATSKIGRNGIKNKGNAGKIIVKAQNIEIDGTDDTGKLTTGIFSRTETEGNGGDINLISDTIEMNAGAKISARSQGEGKAGQVFIKGSQFLKADNSIIETYAENSGGGQVEVDLQGGSIQLLNKSKILSKVITGGDDAGHIELKADSIVALHGVEINAGTDDGRGGNIIMDTDVYLKSDDLRTRYCKQT